MNNIQKYIVLLLTVMLLVPDSAWAQENKQEFVIKGVVEDNLGPVAGASIVAKNQPGVGTITNLDGEFTIKVGTKGAEYNAFLHQRLFESSLYGCTSSDFYWLSDS